MFRKMIAVMAAALVAAALLPSLAFAAPTGGASLATGTNVFPGPDRALSIKVDNTGMLLLGESVNWISVILPNNQGFTTTPNVTAPQGWTASVTNTTSVQRYVFSTTGSGVAPNASLTFPFPANVAAPAADRSGDFRVFLSSDRGATTSLAGGALTSIVRTLELQTFGITAPAGAANGTATSGQAVTFTAAVKNYASGAQNVTAATTGGSGTGSIASGATGQIAIPVTLPTVNADGITRFPATATAGPSQAQGINSDVTIQVAPLLTLVPQSFSPNRVRSNAPIEYAFSVGATKRNTPGLTVTACTLIFNAGGNLNSIPLNGSATWTANNQQTLMFVPSTITGPTGTYDTTVNCNGTDANDAPYAQAPLNGTLTLNIDNLGPIITGLTLTPPANQTAVKNSDTVNVRFDIDDTGATFTTTEVRDNRGNKVPITDLSRSGNTYTGRAVINFPLDEGTVFAQIEAIDFVGGNPGAASSAVLPLDNLVPVIANPARTLSTTTIEVFIQDTSPVSGGCDAGNWRVENNVVTAVRGEDGAACGAGGSAYRVLVLVTAINRDATPAVTYSQQGISVPQTPIRDGAANQALTRTVDTVVGILPPAPNLTQVRRNGETETAVLDADSYWTRFTGSDLVVSFTGASAGYTAYVVDGSGRDLTGPIGLGGGTDKVAIPIDNAPGTYRRGIQMANSAGRGEVRYFNVSVDQAVPLVTSATINGQQVTVGFNDVVWAGDNFAADWFGYENTPDGRAAYQPSRVDIAGGNLTTRVLTFQFANPNQFANLVDYLNSGSIRYVDRAGNSLADTLS